MRIVIVGDGKIGHTLAETLSGEGHDVVIIDKSGEALGKSVDTLDVLCIKGSGANIPTLIEADARHADIIIATTASDETNMVCCLIAKHLGAQYAIARIRDPEYNNSLSLIKKELSIDLAVNPERTTAMEISRLLRYPFASKVEIFARGRVEMVEFRAQAGDKVVGVPLSKLSASLPGLPQVLYCAIERFGEAIIPDGTTVIEPGDRVHVAADIPTITGFFRHLGKHDLRVQSVMVLGGGRISFYLTRLLASLGMRVSIVEIDRRKAELLAEQLPEADVICGDGTDQELLVSEGIADMDAFIALTDRDEENLLTGIYAQRMGVKKVVVKINRGNYADIVASMGIDSVVTPRQITCDTLLRYVRARSNSRGTVIERMYRILDGHAEALEFIAQPDDPYIRVPLRDLAVARETLVAVIVRDGRIIVPFGDDYVQGGDFVIIITKRQGITDLKDVLKVHGGKA